MRSVTGSTLFFMFRSDLKCICGIFTHLPIILDCLLGGRYVSLPPHTPSPVPVFMVNVFVFLHSIAIVSEAIRTFRIVYFNV